MSIRVLQAIGIDYARDYVARFGFNKQDLPRNLSLALGTANLTPMEVATGWSTFANGGYKIQPYLIDRIDSRDGQPLFIANPASVPQNSPQSIDSQDLPDTIDTDANAITIEPAAAERIIDERTAFILTLSLIHI